MFDIGILGGMGPIATSVLYNRIINFTFANKDQNHPKTIIISDSSVPDRTDYILGKSDDNPLVEIEKDIDVLNLLQCKTVIMGCNTAHYFHKEVAKRVNGKFLNMVKLALDYIKFSHLPDKICVLCTLGAKKANVFSEWNESVFYPDDENCKKIQEIIYYIKDTVNFDLQNATLKLQNVIDDIRNRFGENITFLLGCTELSVLSKSMKNDNVVDAMDVVAIASIIASGFTPNCKNSLDLTIIKSMVED